MNKKIEFDYKDNKHYVLEFSREAIKLMESRGLKISNIADQPITSMELLFEGAFLKNHKNITGAKVLEIYNDLGDKTKLNEKLIEMFTETYTSLIGDGEEEDQSKKVQWEVV